MIWVIGHGNTPRKPILGTRNRQVFLHVAVKEVHNFLVPNWRVYKVWVALDVAEELVTERRQAKQVVFFLDPFYCGPGLDRDVTASEVVTCRSDLRNLGISIEALICDGVPPRVLPFVYQALLLEEILSNG